MADGAPTAEAVQAAINKMRGVMANRVVVEDGKIAEVHILARADRPAKQIVRDVESLCAAEFGVKIDHRKVSVALINAPKGAEARRARPEIKGVRSETRGGYIKLHVTLGVGEETYEGAAEGPRLNEPRLAAQAALSALEQYLRGSCRLVLNDLVPFHLGGWDGYLVGVAMLSTCGEERLVGSALVKHDRIDAVVRASCNAVNRRIGIAGG